MPPLNNRRDSKESKKSGASKYLELINEGASLTKIRGKDGKKFSRRFRLDDDHLAFTQTSSKKASCGQGAEAGKVYLSEIQDVRPGPNSDVFVVAFDKLKVKPEQCFTVVIGSKHKTLDLVADSVEMQQAWVVGLKHLKKNLAQADLMTQQDVWRREMFRYADRNGDGVLSLKEVTGLLKYLNIEVAPDQAKQIFDSADTKKEKNRKGEDGLDLDEFVLFYKSLTNRTEVEQLFEKYNYEGKYLDADELKDFLALEQHMDVSVEDCERLIHEYEPVPTNKAQNFMSIDGFNALVSSPMMDIFDYRHREVYQNMDLPLSHYWIDSSHNTYLTADQLLGNSAVEAYIRALKRGCRCVELDVWNGGKNEDPVVYHGHTLTSKILFKDVLQAINLYAFESSDYPLILSIENHCSVEQQKTMARYMRTILGDKLLTTPLDSVNKLPSPNQLKGKILVKGKKLPDGDDEVSDEDEAADIDDDTVKEDVQQKKKSTNKVQLARELSDCVVLCQSVAFKGFDYAVNNYNHLQMSSFAEGKAEDLASDKPERYIKHNQFQLSRIYPSGIRTDSSNYSAVPLWNAGCQVVALNYQTPDDPMMHYKGRFRDNGGAGYVLKPSMLLSPESTFNPKKGPFPPEWKKTLKLTIISGYQLPKKKKDKEKSILDPWVKVDILGVDKDMKSDKTVHVHNNGFHPVWNHTMTFDVRVPQLALVHFQVKDYEAYSRDETVAQYCLPFSSLQQGVRTVHLATKQGEPIFGAALIVNVEII
jgi:phosphatidylinositol phospholipase C delta